MTAKQLMESQVIIRDEKTGEILLSFKPKGIVEFRDGRKLVRVDIRK